MFLRFLKRRLNKGLFEAMLEAGNCVITAACLAREVRSESIMSTFAGTVTQPTRCDARVIEGGPHSMWALSRSISIACLRIVRALRNASYSRDIDVILQILGKSLQCVCDVSL